jgi:hypothetical protein
VTVLPNVEMFVTREMEFCTSDGTETPESLLKRQHKRTWNREKVGDGYFRREEAVMADKIQKMFVDIFNVWKVIT